MDKLKLFYELVSARGIKAGPTGQAMTPHPKTTILAHTISSNSAIENFPAAALPTGLIKLLLLMSF